MKQYLVILIPLLLWLVPSAEAQLSFVPVYGVKPISAGLLVRSADSSTLSIDILKGYISQVKFVKDGRVTKERNSYHLVDFLDATPLHFEVPVAKYDSIVFVIGIDSTVQVQGVLEGALDPSNGMYWTWQSGYIHFKLEGTSSVCTARNHQFQYHIGGYRFPNNTCREVRLPFVAGMQVGIDVGKLLEYSLPISAEIMSPGSTAAQFSDVLQNCFYRIEP